MNQWKLGILGAILVTISCGEPTDRPEDCNANEYFDESRSLCLSCPAAIEPSCDDGCGFAVSSDDRGCPTVECLIEGDPEQDLENETCSTCEPDEFFSANSLQCEACSGPATCSDGEQSTRWISDDECVLQCP